MRLVLGKLNGREWPNGLKKFLHKESIRTNTGLVVLQFLVLLQ